MLTKKRKKQLRAARAKLVKAKPVAVKNWPSAACILRAFSKNYGWETKQNPFVFCWPDGSTGNSIPFVYDHAKSPADIARVFDASIADIDRQLK